MEPIQEVMRLEVEKALTQRNAEGGGGVYFSVEDWAENLKISESEVLRSAARLLEQEPRLSITLEIFGVAQPETA